MTRWLIVAAVSTKDRGQTVEQQVEALTAAATRHGATVAEVLTFTQSRYQQASALEVERQVLARVAKGDVEVVALWALDRLTRRGPAAALGILQTLEGHHKVGVFSLQEPFLSTATMDPSVRGLLLPLFAWIAEQESARKAARINAKVESKKAHAEAGGGRAKWGRGVMAGAADEARVAELRAQGLSVRAIAAEVGLSKSAVGRILAAVA